MQVKHPNNLIISFMFIQTYNKYLVCYTYYIQALLLSKTIKEIY